MQLTEKSEHNIFQWFFHTAARRIALLWKDLYAKQDWKTGEQQQARSNTKCLKAKHIALRKIRTPPEPSPQNGSETVVDFKRSKMSQVTRKPVFGVSNQVRFFKSACAATEIM